MRLIYFFLVSLLMQNCTSTNQNIITIQGMAMDAKAGAVVVTEEEDIYYIENLDYWEEEFVGKQVEVSGELVVMHHKASQGEAQSQEMSGSQNIIKNPKWKIL